MFDQAKNAEFSSEPVVVVGVVHPRGSGGIGGTTGEEWTLIFAFESWMGEDAVLHSTELAIRRDVTRDELDWYMSQIEPYAILAVRVHFTGSNTVELLEILEQPINPDNALVQRAAELLKPKTYQHEFFGTLTFDREIDWYRVIAVWVEKNVELNLSTDDNDADVKAALQVALKLWDDQKSWNQRIEDFVIQEKLDSYNNGWREDNDPELTPEEFRSRISLEEIIVYPNGEFDFCYDAGYLFGYHQINVSGSLHDGLIATKI